jgi:hypothetical protein
MGRRELESASIAAEADHARDGGTTIGKAAVMPE